MYTCQTSVKFAMNAMCCTNKRICPIYPYIVELTAIDWFTCIQSHDIDHYLSLEYVNKFSIQSSLCNVAPASTLKLNASAFDLWLFANIFGTWVLSPMRPNRKKKTIKLLFKVENAIIQRARERAAESS